MVLSFTQILHSYHSINHKIPIHNVTQSFYFTCLNTTVKPTLHRPNHGFTPVEQHVSALFAGELLLQFFSPDGVDPRVVKVKPALAYVRGRGLGSVSIKYSALM